jgi:hypothetical protein
MKLYSTATSERASKGQGGNKWLRVELEAEIEGKRETVARINLYPPVKNNKKADLLVEWNGEKSNLVHLAKKDIM